MSWFNQAIEQTLSEPINCLVNGKPAEIIGYGADNTVDYRQDGQVKWMRCGSYRMIEIGE